MIHICLLTWFFRILFTVILGYFTSNDEHISVIVIHIWKDWMKPPSWRCFLWYNNFILCFRFVLIMSGALFFINFCSIIFFPGMIFGYDIITYLFDQCRLLRPKLQLIPLNVSMIALNFSLLPSTYSLRRCLKLLFPDPALVVYVYHLFLKSSFVFRSYILALCPK